MHFTEDSTELTRIHCTTHHPKYAFFILVDEEEYIYNN